MIYSDITYEELEGDFLLSVGIPKSGPARDCPVHAAPNICEEAILRDRVRSRRSDRLVNTAEAGAETPQPSPA